MGKSIFELANTASPWKNDWVTEDFSTDNSGSGYLGSGYLNEGIKLLKGLLEDRISQMEKWTKKAQDAYEDPTLVIRKTFEASGGKARFDNQPSLNKLGTISKCTSCFKGGGNYNPDNFINQTSSMIDVNEGGITKVNFVNIMLGHFIAGTATEHFVFPKNGEISNEMRDSVIATYATYKWLLDNFRAISNNKMPKKPRHEYESFGLLEQGYVSAENFDKSKGWFSAFSSIENFVGSARVSVVAINENIIEVIIRNITSLESGDLLKHVPMRGKTESKKRDLSKSEPQEFSNFSQKYSFTMRIEDISPVVSRSRKMIRNAKKLEDSIEKTQQKVKQKAKSLLDTFRWD